MLTIFTIPKPFQGHIGIIQRNAIQSWLKLQPKCEIILFGDEDGIAETAAEFGVTHVPNIQKNEYGTPLLDFVFESAQQMTSHNLVCYVNADIILLNDLLSSIQQIQFNKFLMVGQRWDLNLDKVWNFEDNKWEEHLRNYLDSHGVLHPPVGSDYFIFPKWALGTLPPFAVGRPGWDNWVIYRARKLGIPVIDTSPMVTAIHQNHDYGHVPDGTGRAYEGPEANQNRDLIGNWDYFFTLQDANWVLTSQGLRRQKWTKEYLGRFMTTLPVLQPQLRPIALLGNAILRRIP